MTSKVRFLIVDDQKSIRELLKELVARLGAEVIGEAEDGEQAVEKFAELRPHMVLLDINMPRMDGVEALKRIAAIDPDAVVIMLTSQNTVDVVRDCLESGARNFLLKSNPVDVLFQELKDTWTDYIAEGRHARRA